MQFIQQHKICVLQKQWANVHYHQGKTYFPTGRRPNLAKYEISPMHTFRR